MSKSPILPSLFLIAGLLLAATQAHAEELTAAEQAPGYHQHDDWYLRITYSLGATSVSSGSLETIAVSSGQTVAVGHSIAERLILFGEINATTGDVVEANPAEPEDFVLESTTLGLGVGLAYYTPSNWFASTTLGVSAQLLDGAYGNRTVNAIGGGLAGSLMLGKEWWTFTRDGSIGVAARLAGHSSPDVSAMSAMLVGTITID